MVSPKPYASLMQTLAEFVGNDGASRYVSAHCGGKNGVKTNGNEQIGAGLGKSCFSSFCDDVILQDMTPFQFKRKLLWAAKPSKQTLKVGIH